MREFNPVVTGMVSSVTLALNAKAKELSLKGKEIYNLSAGEPDWPTPNYIQEFVAQKLNENKYTPASGLSELRVALAQYCSDLYHTEKLNKKNVVITPGVKPALFSTLMTLLKTGDEVIVPAPYWVSYKQIIELAGGKMISVKTTDTFNLNVEAINRAITPRTKVIILNSPNNPTGAVYSQQVLVELANLIADKDIFVLSDDIYIRLAYENIVPITQCGFNQQKLIIINGFSKSQALTGWRVGYIIASQEIASMIGKLNSHILGNTSLPAQYAAIAALKRNDDPPMLEQLKKRRAVVIRELSKIKFLSFIPPKGAFYVFVNISRVTNNDSKWCEDLLEKTGVCLIPGEAFGAPGYVRLSFTADEATLKKAIVKIDEYIKSGTKK